jgi:hypothetical protein
MLLTIHASLDHTAGMLEAKRVLESLGCQVMLPDLRRHQYIRDDLGDNIAFSKIKESLQRQNAESVAKSDALLIVNPFHRGVENYVGGAAFFSMSIAFFLRRPILMTNCIPEGLPYTEEIWAFHPVVIGPASQLDSRSWNLIAARVWG